MKSDDFTDQEMIDWLRKSQDVRVCLSHDIRMCRVRPSPRELIAAEHIEKLLARIAELEDEIDHLEKNFTEWLKQYRAQTERIVDLEAALKPFSEAAEELTDKDKDNWSVYEHHAAHDITIEDLRKARLILEKK